MFPDKFFEVLKHEGVVSITTWSDNEAHVTNTWNSYLKIKENDRVIVTMGAREVEGFNGYQGTGFRVEGTATFIGEGPIYDEMYAEFPFLKRVLAVKAESAKQLL